MDGVDETVTIELTPAGEAIPAFEERCDDPDVTIATMDLLMLAISNTRRVQRLIDTNAIRARADQFARRAEESDQSAKAQTNDKFQAAMESLAAEQRSIADVLTQVAIEIEADGEEEDAEKAGDGSPADTEVSGAEKAGLNGDGPADSADSADPTADDGMDADGMVVCDVCNARLPHDEAGTYGVTYVDGVPTQIWICRPCTERAARELDSPPATPSAADSPLMDLDDENAPERYDFDEPVAGEA